MTSISANINRPLAICTTRKLSADVGNQTEVFFSEDKHLHLHHIDGAQCCTQLTEVNHLQQKLSHLTIVVKQLETEKRECVTE